MEEINMSTEMRPEQGIAGKFVRSALDENGVLSKIEFTNSENFNFAYDVMDALTALIYVSKDRTIEKKFTFQNIKDYSNRAANYFKSLGIRKGDTAFAKQINAAIEDMIKSGEWERAIEKNTEGTDYQPDPKYNPPTPDEGE